MEEREISVSNMGDEDEERTILVSGVPTDFHLEAIQSYFECKRISNGGPIKGNPKRTHDFGKVIITFESEKDAENVVQKKIHNVSKYDLRVNRYKNIVWQEDAMIVSNGYTNIPVKMLIDFLEKNGNLDIVYVSPGRKPGIFLVYCQNEIDFEYVQLCQENHLKSNQLKVDTVEEINSVLVKTYVLNVTSDSFNSYFGERKRSSSGDISSIQQQTKDTYIVSFKEKSVVLDVCRRQHLMEGVKLNVQPFWESFEENIISRQQVHHYLLPSNCHLTFLKKHKSIVNDQLKKWAKVMWKDSKFNKLKLNYTEENVVEIEQHLNDLLNSITVEIVDIPTDIFEDIVRIFSNEADQRYFYFDNRNCQANILGFNKSNVIKMKKRLLDNFKTTCEVNLNIHERHILSVLRFFEQAERRFKDLKIRCHGNKIIFEGHCSEIANCEKYMYKFLQSVVNSKLSLPLNTGMIINKKPVKEYLDAKLRNKNCIGSWETSDDDSVLLYASDKKNLSLLEEIMKETFVVNELDFIHKIKGTSNYGKWLTFVESLKEKFSDFYFIGEDSLSFVAVDVVVKDIKRKIDNFEQSLIYESQISMTHAHYLFLKQFNEQKINDFRQKNKIKNVCLKENKINMEGTENQIREMKIFIENLRKDISSKVVKFEMFGFQEFLDHEEGVSFLSEMQKKFECIILNSDLGCETKEILNFVYKNCEIVLREGDITTLDTDAIVNAANGRLEHMGGIAAAIVQKGGFQIQAESKRIMEQRRCELKTGEVVSTNAGKLKCKTVIHAVGPVWNNGRSHEMFHLSRAVQNCLAFLDESSYTSIAIPAISTGIFGIPIEEGTICTLTTIKNYLDIHSNSKIKHICLIDIRKEVIRAFKLHLETVFGISKHKEDEDDKEMEENLSADQQDVGVTLKFIAKYKNLDHVIKTVKREYRSLLTTEEILFDVDLIEDRKLRLMNIRREHKIQISVSDSIKIFGRLSHVKDAKLAVQTLIIEFKETDMESSYKEMAQWYYFVENRPQMLTKFSDKENVKLEKAFLQKKNSLTWQNIKYNIQQMSCQISGRKYKMKRKQNQKDELILDRWSPMGDKKSFKIVPVRYGPEYDDIQNTFRWNLPSSRIIKIERIQNKTLYDGYQALKTKFESDNPSIRNEVDGLWHGTAAEPVDRINKYGFNRNYCKATAFGEGVYFAKDIKYSASDIYSTPDPLGIKKIYKCSVLVGKVMQGQQGLKYLQDSNNSAVDDIQNPSIYVTFHDYQAYPNYLITFYNH